MPWHCNPQMAIVLSFIERQFMDVAKEFGKKLREKRKSLGLSQDKLALDAEIDRSYIGRVERGEVNVTLKVVYTLAATLKCEVKILLP